MVELPGRVLRPNQSVLLRILCTERDRLTKQSVYSIRTRQTKQRVYSKAKGFKHSSICDLIKILDQFMLAGTTTTTTTTTTTATTTTIGPRPRPPCPPRLGDPLVFS